MGLPVRLSGATSNSTSSEDTNAGEKTEEQFEQICFHFLLTAGFHISGHENGSKIFFKVQKLVQGLI